MALPSDAARSTPARYASWLVIGCTTLCVGLLSACLLVVAALRLTGGEPLVSLMVRLSRPASRLEPAPRGRPVFSDDFTDNRSGWNLFQGERGEVRLVSGRLQLTVVGPDVDVWATAPAIFGDFRLEVDTGLSVGPPETRYGVIFRHQDDDNFYQFEVDGLGRFSLGKVVGGNYTALLAPTPSALVQPGQALNHLEVVAVGPRITVAVNGTTVHEVIDRTFERGHIGVTASLEGEGRSRIVFDDLHLYRP